MRRRAGRRPPPAGIPAGRGPRARAPPPPRPASGAGGGPPPRSRRGSEPYRLRATQPGRVDKLDERPIADGERAVAPEPVEQCVDLVRLRHQRESPPTPWGQRGVRHAARPESEAKQRAYGRELASDRRGRQSRPASAELRCVFGEHAYVDVGQLQAPGAEPARKLLEVGAVGAPCPVGKCRAGQKALDLLHENGFRDAHGDPYGPVATWRYGLSCVRGQAPQRPRRAALAAFAAARRAFAYRPRSCA